MQTRHLISRPNVYQILIISQDPPRPRTTVIPPPSNSYDIKHFICCDERGFCLIIQTRVFFERLAFGTSQPIVVAFCDDTSIRASQLPYSQIFFFFQVLSIEFAAWSSHKFDIEYYTINICTTGEKKEQSYVMLPDGTQLCYRWMLHLRHKT